MNLLRKHGRKEEEAAPPPAKAPKPGPASVKRRQQQQLDVHAALSKINTFKTEVKLHKLAPRTQVPSSSPQKPQQSLLKPSSPSLCDPKAPSSQRPETITLSVDSLKNKPVNPLRTYRRKKPDEGSRPVVISPLSKPGALSPVVKPASPVVVGLAKDAGSAPHQAKPSIPSEQSRPKIGPASKVKKSSEVSSSSSSAPPALVQPIVTVKPDLDDDVVALKSEEERVQDISQKCKSLLSEIAISRADSTSSSFSSFSSSAPFSLSSASSGIVKEENEARKTVTLDLHQPLKSADNLLAPKQESPSKSHHPPAAEPENIPPLVSPPSIKSGPPFLSAPDPNLIKTTNPLVATERPHRCPLCHNKETGSFEKEFALNRHLKELHSRVMEYVCAQCGGCFPLAARLVDHYKREHMGIMAGQ